MLPIQLARVALGINSLAALLTALLELRWPEIGWRHIDLRDLDLDLRRVGGDRLVEPIGHRPRPEDDDDDQNHLQHHPGDGSPVDLRRLDGGRGNAPQGENGEAKRGGGGAVVWSVAE